MEVVLCSSISQVCYTNCTNGQTMLSNWLIAFNCFRTRGFSIISFILVSKVLKVSKAAPLLANGVCFGTVLMSNKNFKYRLK